MKRPLLLLALPFWLLWALLYGCAMGALCCLIDAYYTWKEWLCEPSPSSPPPSWPLPS